MKKTTYYPPQVDEFSARLEVNIMSNNGEVQDYNVQTPSSIGLSWD